MLRRSVAICALCALGSFSGCSSDSPGNAGGAGSVASAGSGHSSAGSAPSGGSIGAAGAAGSAVGGGGSGNSFAGAAGASAGSGGAGPGGAPSTAGAAGSPTACAFCDDFEGVASGSPPDPTKWTLVAPDCSDNPAVPVVDATQHHGGTRSLKVAGVGDSCHNAMFGNTAAFKALGNVVYGRFFVRFETALSSGHVAFATFPEATKGNDLRLGGQSQALEWNRQNGDATLPSQSPVGIAMSKVPPPATWVCLEFMIDQAQGLINTWVDDVLVPGLVADATPTPDVDTAWTTYRPNLVGFNLGWQSFGGGAMNLWFDDVALSTVRIHCQ